MSEPGREREAGPRAPFPRPEAGDTGLSNGPNRSRLVLRAAVLVAVVAMTLTSTLAYASWTNSGVGLGSARATLTGAGSSPTPTTSGRNVSLTWAASTYSNGVTVPSYLVKRYNDAGTVVQAMTFGSCASLVTGTTCTEAAVPTGSWKYSVTPAVGNWRGAESTKVNATVGAVSLALTSVLTRATATLSGTAADFVTGQSVTFRLDNATSGTVLAGTLAGVATPTTVGATGGGAVTVTLPAGTTAGAHTVYAVTANGENASQAISVDNTPPPAPSITSGPAAGVTVTATTATFAFTNTEPGVTFMCALDGGTAVACSTGKNYTGLADGSHTFSVSALEPAGNESTATTRTWTVDTTGPVNTITFPVDADVYGDQGFKAGCGTAGPGSDMCGTTSDASGVSTVRVSLLQASTGEYWNGGAGAAADFVSTSEVLLTATGTTSWTIAAPDGANFTDGLYTLRVVATDGLGNVSSTTIAFRYDRAGLYDTTPPAGGVTSPADGASYNVTTYAALCGSKDLCGTAFDAGSGVDTKRVSIRTGSGHYWNGSSFASATEVLLNTTGLGNSWDYTLAAGSLPDGAYTVTLHVTDVAGNTSAAITSTWTMDRIAPPAPSITSSSPSSSPTASTTATFSFTDAEPGVTFKCSLDGGAATICSSGDTHSPLADGAHTFSVMATDAAGNTSTATAATAWTVDATGPATVATFPVDGSTYSVASYNAGCSTGGGDLCGTTSDAVSGVSTVRVSVQRASTGLYWNGTSFVSAAEDQRTPTGTTSWSLTLLGASLADGSYTVRTYATDWLSNVSTTTSTFTIDATAPPTPSITVGPSGTTTSSTASFTFTDTEPAVAFLCTMDGGPAVACTSPTVYRALSNASHTFTVKAVDAVGNISAAATRTWSVNAAVPGGALTFPVTGTTYTGPTWGPGCSSPAGDICGTAPVGTTAVALSIKQVSSGLYWDGSAFADEAETVVDATGTTAWSYSLTTAQQPDGDYTVRYYVTPASGNVSQGSTAVTYTMDTPPVAYAPSTTNAGTAGELGTGDTLVLTSSKQLLASSILAGWSGSSTDIVIRANHAGPGDSLTFWDAANATQLDLGTIDLDDKKWVKGNITFGLTGTPSTMVQSGSTITLTFGTVSDASKLDAVTGTNMTWTPGPGATDLAGMPFGPPPAVTETDNDTDF